MSRHCGHGCGRVTSHRFGKNMTGAPNKEVWAMKVFARCVFLILMIWVVPPLRASEIRLPEIGTNVNYNYSLATPQFVVGTKVPSDRLNQSEVTFAENKTLFFDFEPEQTGRPPFIQFDVEFRGTGLRSLFDPVYISFNEEVWLLLKNGERSPPATNAGIGYYDENPDIYTFSWSLFPENDFTLYGIQWKITPDLVAGAVLPEADEMRFEIFTSGRIIVAPEPGSSLSVMVLIAVCIRRQRMISRAWTGG